MIVKKSLRQLLRTPLRAALFFLLMTASTLLLVFGAVLFSQSTQRIAVAESEFETVGTVEQVPIDTRVTVTPDVCQGLITRSSDIYGETFSVDQLDFPGANYILPPENRPYYVAYLPEMRHTTDPRSNDQIVEFTPLADSDGSEGPVEARITKVLGDRERSIRDLKEGDEVLVCQCGGADQRLLEAGKTYVAALWWLPCPAHGGYDSIEYSIFTGPYSTQRDAAGGTVDAGYFPEKTRRAEEVTADFYEEGNRGQDWLKWADFQGNSGSLFSVMPTNNIRLLPSFHAKLARMKDGREITEEEYASGAAVCVVSASFAQKNLLRVGDKIELPLLCTLYGCAAEDVTHYSLLNAEGEYYEPFWTAEYEIVGTYALTNEDGSGMGELTEDLIIIPSASVGASDDNNIAYFDPINALSCSFQIPNGTIDAFDAALRQNVEGLEQLEIRYDDRGYSDVMNSLLNARNTAMLLFAFGLLSVAAVIALLLYFFVVKEKKRTAIERALGFTKRQCRISIVSGVLALALVSTIVSTVLGAALTGTVGGAAASSESVSITSETEEEAPATVSARFSRKYSLWAGNESFVENSEVETPVALFFLIPASLLLVILCVSVVLVNRNIRTDPVYLLSRDAN